MIDENVIFNEVRDNISMMCADDCKGADLAATVGIAISHKMKSVCVPPEQVADVWPWLEKTKIKILSCFVVGGAINEDFISDFSMRVNKSFRDGANGAIILVSLHDLPKFAAELSSVRDDLFFNKSVSIGINIDEVNVFDWAELFGIMHLLKTDSLSLVFDNDTGDKSDFVGRIYAMLNAPRGDWKGGMNFVMGQNFVRIDQVYRLIQQCAPALLSGTEFFIDNA